VVFEAEREEEDVMRRPPRDPASPLLLPRRIWWAITQGLVSLAILSGVLLAAAQRGLPEADLRALVFASLVLVNISLILVNRSFNASLLRALLRPNRSLWILLGGVLALLAAAVYWPPAQALFHFGRMHGDDLAWCIGAGVLSLLLLEALKSRWFRPTVKAP
jgi:Ca2+-transporting ATPase